MTEQTANPKAPFPERARPETQAAQALGWIEPPHGDLAPAIHPASTFERAADGSYPTGKSYGRGTNPTTDAPEAVLAALEHGAGALLYASGMAAATSVFQSLAPGDHVIAPLSMYWGLREWLTDWARPWGLDVDFAATEDLDALEAAVRPATRLIWVETPGNPDWRITNIAATAEIAHAAGALLAVDNTVATPVLTRPLTLGADLVMHSATKYLNGHSDLIAGAVVAARDDEFFGRLRFNRDHGGAVLGAFEAWLLMRGMRTLFIRVGRASQSALGLARHFDGDDRLASVLYPGLQNFPGHGLAARQMQGGFGGMLSLRVKGGEPAAMAVAGALKLFKRATSLGGVESLVEHRASIEGPNTPVPDDLLRLSVGIEYVEDLIGDLEQALDHVYGAESALFNREGTSE